MASMKVIEEKKTTDETFSNFMENSTRAKGMECIYKWKFELRNIKGT